MYIYVLFYSVILSCIKSAAGVGLRGPRGPGHQANSIISIIVIIIVIVIVIIIINDMPRWYVYISSYLHV